MADLGEKTEQPTSRRLSEARERGQVARSMDLAAAVVLTGAFLMVFLFGPELFRVFAVVMERSLGREGVGVGIRLDSVTSDTMAMSIAVGVAVLPILGIMFLVAYIAGLMQVGFLLTLRPLEPKLERLNVIRGIGRLFSKRSLVKGGLDLGKLAIIGSVVFIVVRLRMDQLVGLATLSVGAGVAAALQLIAELAIWCLAVLFVLGILDWSFQKWQRTQDLRMTKQEVKDERKSTEGDMQMKARRMQLARTIAMQRLGRDVPTADVVVANPTHFSVALKYDAEKMHAPRVVAKGADYLALRIRHLATAHGIPVVERPPLARALYAQVEVGREINPEHYEAVAEVLAYVYRLDEKAAAS
ncbi:MAG: flagellar biosynthesis protein FlhB [Phycisphaerales bacterium]|nr:flagellar biosynthesis protein FlhB [Phycisphaerales bacterium]